ncbi:MAG: erythromycin esterase family protein [Pseudomonadota bacterium]|nr:erythromycin esterase family protein [Pseudomonadota bacterium]
MFLIQPLRSSLAFLAALLALSACAAAGPSGQDQERGPEGSSASGKQPSTEWAGAVVPISGDATDHDTIVQAAQGARFVLLGESTHGTHEYYRERGRISDRLIRELGFGAVAIEGDWSATYRVNRYVRGLGPEKTAEQALAGYRNFPQWMWRNVEFRDFIDRLRTWNMGQPEERRVGVYGMDVYDLFDAADAVVAYLARVNTAAAARARREYRCFGPYRRDTHAYGAAARRAAQSCREEAAAVVAEMARIPRPGAPVEAEQHFAAIRSAASVAAGEEYFRTVYAGSLAWNVRDQHMARNVEEIAEHVARQSGRPGKVVVWGHNTHVGDARATFAAKRGELNLGQLMRQRHRDAAFLVGFFTYTGQVMAAPEWDMPGRVYDVRPALPGSYSDVFHQSGVPAFSLLLRGNKDLARRFGEPRLERAIGVVYLPQTERQSHYFEARISDQFDAIIFFDRTRAVTPLR